jgi:hypothetical protein
MIKVHQPGAYVQPQFAASNEAMGHMSVRWGTRAADASQTPAIKGIVPVYVVQKSILLLLDPLFGHPTNDWRI